jgi:hypothetical protein
MLRRIIYKNIMDNKGRYMHQDPRPRFKGKKIFNQTKIKRHEDLRSIFKVRIHDV